MLSVGSTHSLFSSLLSVILIYAVRGQTQLDFGPSTLGNGVCYTTADTAAPKEQLDGFASTMFQGWDFATGALPASKAVADQKAEFNWALGQAASKVTGTPKKFWLAYKYDGTDWATNGVTRPAGDFTVSSGGTETCAAANSVSPFAWTDEPCDGLSLYGLFTKEVTCDKSVANSDAASGTAIAGEEVTWTCDNGYLLEGSATSTCQCKDDAPWDPVLPECLQNTCTKPASAGLTVTPDQATYDPLDVINVACPAGQILSGDQTLTCEKQPGKYAWSSASPSCIDISAITAPPPPTISYSQEGLEPGKGLEWTVPADALADSYPEATTPAPAACTGVWFNGECWNLMILVLTCIAAMLLCLVVVGGFCIAFKRCARGAKFGKLEAEL